VKPTHTKITNSMQKIQFKAFYEKSTDDLGKKISYHQAETQRILAAKFMLAPKRCSKFICMMDAE